ncbi:hypothetical protein ACLKA6_016707 [Drosophila palustris]
MHFWIDKRSQQTGYGRSRVAASLSHAGGGLSYGHPPRRSKSSSNSNNVSSNMAASGGNSSGSHNQNLASVHRGLAPFGGNDFQTGASSSRQASHYTSSNNNAHASNPQLLHHSSINNNSSSNAAMTTATASNNNNANSNATASSAAVLTGSGTIVPLVARGSHYHQQSTRNSSITITIITIILNLAIWLCPCGNLRPQQQQQQQQQHQLHSGVYADDAYSAYHHHSGNSCSNNTNNSRYATPRRHNSSNNMRHATAVAAAAAATTTTSTITVTPMPPTQTTTGHSSNNNQLQQQHQHHAMLQHAESQLLPSHLKCGMCASLVLASVFVAGAKFYFDHQGTGLEVLIFCAFSATFFLAACMVSLCRIPKGFLPTRSNGRAVCHSRGVNTSANNASGCMLELNDVRYLDERQVEISAATAAAAAAGPPPYHIAILLPEQTPTAMGNKQLPLDESPPPSYDKILV